MRAPKHPFLKQLEHLAYQGIMQVEKGYLFKYRNLVGGPDAASWLGSASQEWDRSTATLHFVPASTKPKGKKAAYLKHLCTEKIKPLD
jgi:hypothetical protein